MFPLTRHWSASNRGVVTRARYRSAWCTRTPLDENWQFHTCTPVGLFNISKFPSHSVISINYAVCTPFADTFLIRGTLVLRSAHMTVA
jgi:hypothetical protein